MEKKTFYITTPIYYPSDKLHIGNTYTTVAADAIARYKKLRGYDVKFLTGTDEHGQKIERIANEKNTTPKEYVDGIVKWIKKLWETMDIDYDIFIRTTDDYHEKAVQKIFRKLYENGDIYKSEYDGLYCTPCETFFTERQLVDGKCPDCGRPVEHMKEESYFFKLSKYQDKLIKHIEENPDFIQPVSRRNEMLNNFLKVGLEDLCVSRTSFKWGVPVDFDNKHVVYVWVDALTNYINALGYLSENDVDYKKYWPADVHLVGKDILRFHTIIWPAILMSLGEPLPKQVFGHGWLLFGDQKMSKSKGNVVDPIMLVDRYGVDAIRYFLLREIQFGQDGSFTNEALIQRMNSDLANDLGNLVSRTVGMIEKYFNGEINCDIQKIDLDDEIISLSKEVVEKIEKDMDKLLISDALTELWVLVRRLNKYIDETAPWVLAKDETKKNILADVMYTLCEGIRVIATVLRPFLTKAPEKIASQIGISEKDLEWDNAKKWNILDKNIKVKKGEIIFPRLDLNKELEELGAIFEAQREAVNNQNKEEVIVEVEKKPEITIDDFDKVQLRVGEIIACEAVKKSKKLLCSQVKIGNEVKQIVSGIRANYSSEEMVGKKVVVVTNLKPAKLAGVLSEGMLLCAENEKGELSLLTTEKDMPSGAEIS